MIFIPYQLTKRDFVKFSISFSFSVIELWSFARNDNFFVSHSFSVSFFGNNFRVSMSLKRSILNWHGNCYSQFVWLQSSISVSVLLMVKTMCLKVDIRDV